MLIWLLFAKGSTTTPWHEPVGSGMASWYPTQELLSCQDQLQVAILGDVQPRDNSDGPFDWGWAGGEGMLDSVGFV